jgi:hypothetical protein
MGFGLRSDLIAKLNIAVICVALVLVGAIVIGVF